MDSAANAPRQTVQYELTMNSCKQDFLTQLCKMYENEELCDLHLYGEKNGASVEPTVTSIKAHRLILSLYSRKFRKFITEGDPDLDPHLTKTLNRQTRPESTTIIFHSAPHRSLRILVDLMYRRSVKVMLSQSDIDELKKLTHFLEMSNFENELQVQLSTLDENNPLHYMKILENTDNKRLRNGTKLFKKLNQEFDTTYPLIKTRISKLSLDNISNILGCKPPHRLREDNLCIIMQDWVTANAMARGTHTKRLLDQLNFTKLSTKVRSNLNEIRNDFGDGKAELLEWLSQIYDQQELSSIASTNYIPPSTNDPYARQQFFPRPYKFPSPVLRSYVPLSTKQTIPSFSMMNIAPMKTNSSKFCLIFGGYDMGNPLKAFSLFDLEKKNFCQPDDTNVKDFDFNQFNLSFRKSSLVATKNVLYFIGGTIDTNPLINVKRFLLDNNKWVNGPNLMEHRYNNASICIGDVIYTVSGCFKNKSRNNEIEYVDSMEMLTYKDIHNFEWKEGPSLGYSVYGHTLCAYGDGFLCIGGISAGSYLNHVRYFSKTTNTWHEHPSMINKRAFHTSTNLRGMVYVLCGYNKHGPMVECERFHNLTRQWEKLQNSPTPMSSHVSCAFEDSNIFCFGGKSNAGRPDANAAVTRYDATSQRWSVLPNRMSRPPFEGLCHYIELPELVITFQ